MSMYEKEYLRALVKVSMNVMIMINLLNVIKMSTFIRVYSTYSFILYSLGILTFNIVLTTCMNCF